MRFCKPWWLLPSYHISSCCAYHLYIHLFRFVIYSLQLYIYTLWQRGRKKTDHICGIRWILLAFKHYDGYNTENSYVEYQTNSQSGLKVVSLWFSLLTLTPQLTFLDYWSVVPYIPIVSVLQISCMWNKINISPKRFWEALFPEQQVLSFLNWRITLNGTMSRFNL